MPESYAGLLVRFARRVADLSQRELARQADVPKSTVAGTEAGRSDTGFATVVRLLEAAGFSLLVRDPDGHAVDGLIGDGRRDAAGRRYPAHLDVRSLHNGWWWGDLGWTGRTRPQHTFRLNRFKRDIRRAEYDLLHAPSADPGPVRWTCESRPPSTPTPPWGGRWQLGPRWTAQPLRHARAGP